MQYKVNEPRPRVKVLKLYMGLSRRKGDNLVYVPTLSLSSTGFWVNNDILPDVNKYVYSARFIKRQYWQ